MLHKQLCWHIYLQQKGWAFSLPIPFLQYFHFRSFAVIWMIKLLILTVCYTKFKKTLGFKKYTNSSWYLQKSSEYFWLCSHSAISFYIQIVFPEIWYITFNSVHMNENSSIYSNLFRKAKSKPHLLYVSSCLTA